MKHAFFLFLFFPALLFSQNVNTTFQSKIVFPGKTAANIWGYTAGGYEYALVGVRDGMHVVNITNPTAPVDMFTIPGPVNLWKEIKTYSHYAYVVSEGGMGVQVINMQGLTPASTTLPYHSYYGDGAINGTLNSAHALQVDEAKGYLYIYGSNLFSGRPICLNLNIDPYNPTYVGYFNAASGYVHDGYANNDTLYSGHIYAGKFTMAKRNPDNTFTQLGTAVSTPNVFTHNTWRWGNTVFTTDEVNNSYLAAFDITDPTDVNKLDQIQSNPGSNSMVHNTYIHNGYAVTSWYRDGFTIVDVSRPDNLVQVGNYDTHATSGGGSAGCWGVYPYFPSGTIIASNINGTGANASDGELYIVTPNYQRACFIEGTVRQYTTTGALLDGCLVELLSGSTVVASITTPVNLITENVGVYKTGILTPGTYTLRVSKAGFSTFTQSVTLATNVVNIVNVVLNSAAPVELARFDVQLKEKNTALLSWTTETEHNNKGFDIEHSRDANTWTTLGFVAGQGDSQVKNEYAYTVDQLEAGRHYFRLRQIDYDGNLQASDVRSINVRAQSLQARLAPSAVTDRTTLHIEAGEYAALEAEIEVFNSNFQLIERQKITLDDSRKIDHEINAINWLSGTYRIIVKLGAESTTLLMFKS